jgi:dihydrofolate reductase
MEHTHPKVVLVAALSRKNRALGNKNALLWHIPADLQRFKQKTLGHPVIMGRKTFESIVGMLGKPLPGRKNIVVTRNARYTFEGATVATSLTDALTKAAEDNPSEIHIGGGAELYAQSLPYVDELYLTLVDDEPLADTFFPEFEDQFEIVAVHQLQTHNGVSYQWVDYKRKHPPR